jgi:hypothetical protein
VHREFVAAIDNHGSLGQTDSQLLGHVATVSATVAPALAAVSSSWRWRVNGVPVPGATGRTFVPRRADRGATVTVRETFRATGYRPARVSSPRTSRVGRR